jgi:4-diphosphocytidyl-2-C-methyl-D-erythritol kinase
MIVFPRAKVNIGLRVTRKRDDGFHDIETLFLSIPFADALEFVENDPRSAKDNLVVTGIDPGGNPEDNLVIKAVHSLRQKYDFPFLKIHLHKAIPAGAGLGGGSSDAAYVMRGINRSFGLNISCEALRTYALEIGSDCPFFVESVPSFATGRGENLVFAGDDMLKNNFMVLLNPGIHVSTKEAYCNCNPAQPADSLPSLLKNTAPDKWKNKIVNDFEDYVFKKYPLIGKIKEELYSAGAAFSLMSGSGSSVYGIFKTRRELPLRLKKYLIWQGFI